MAARVLATGGYKKGATGKAPKKQTPMFPTYRYVANGPFGNAGQLATWVASILNRLAPEVSASAKVSIDQNWAFVWYLE